MNRTELLSWMLEKNGLAETLAELAEGETLTLDQILGCHKPVAVAYHRLCMLDKNGACCAANDIEDTVNLWGGCLDTLAADIHATCNRMLAEEKEGN